jgi:hypothetical protein
MLWCTEAIEQRAIELGGQTVWRFPIKLTRRYPNFPAWFLREVIRKQKYQSK